MYGALPFCKDEVGWPFRRLPRMYPAWGSEARVASGRDGNARVGGLVTRSTAKGWFALDGSGHPAAASQKGVLRAPALAMVPKAASNTRHHAAQLTFCPFPGSEGPCRRPRTRHGGRACWSSRGRPRWMKKIAKRTQSRRQESRRNWHGEMLGDTAYCAGISFIAWPSAASRRVRRWAPHDAAMPIRHGGRLASHSTSCGRGSRRLASAWPRPSMATVDVVRCPAYPAGRGRTVPLPENCGNPDESGGMMVQRSPTRGRSRRT